jgi:short-subunit dehydrogenase
VPSPKQATGEVPDRMGSPSDSLLDGGVVLVTGASSGIGAALARQLAGRAKVLILVARRQDRLQALAEELGPRSRCELEAVDLSDPAQVDALAARVLARHGAVDVLVNNAGLGDIGLFERADLEKLDFMLRVNVQAVLRLTHALLPAMLKAGRGGILNVSSGFGLQFMPLAAAYVGTKHFLTGFTESLRLELVGTGVRVTQICPGPVKTEFEGMAGNPVGRSPPDVVQITAEHCARVAIRGLDRDRALVVPGALMSAVLGLGAWTPRWVLRLLYRGIGSWARARRAV